MRCQMLKIDATVRNYTVSQIQNILNANPSAPIVLQLKTTKDLNSSIINHLRNLNDSWRLKIRIVGAYDDERINNYPDHRQFHSEDNIYSLDETKKILEEIEKIENGINPEWDDLQKLIYFIGYLKNKIIYHPFHEKQPSKDIRSLRGLLSRKTVCAGYAMILKELCDRNGIECQYVEGCCNEKDYQKGLRTHAWNIVKIDGAYLPLDLTWNASKSNTGRSLEIEDLFNVNEFVKNHFPGKKEKIQDYKKELKSIDGRCIRILNSLINKDATFDNTSFDGRRKDGSKYVATLVGQSVVDNTYVYKYIYQDVLPNGKLGKPVLLYSKTNAMMIISIKHSIEKIKMEIREEKAKGHTDKVKELEATIAPEKIQYIYDADELFDEVVFSVANINEAIKRRDYYVGQVIVKPKKVDVLETKGVEVDTDFGKAIGVREKTCTRSDGTHFVIQEGPKINLGNNIELYRYRIIEPVEVSPGNRQMVVNTIFTDQDLLLDTRQDLYDYFLERARLDRKVKEANGYLGYLSSDGIKTYSSNLRTYFSKDLFKRYHVPLAFMKDYYQEITFDEMKRLISTYEEVFENGNTIYRNRASRRVVTDKDLILHLQFSYLWLYAAGYEYSEHEVEAGYNKAFDEESRKFFTYISNAIVSSMNKDGNIDPVEIMNKIREFKKFPEGDKILVKLFGSRESVSIVNTLFRLQNPSAMPVKGDIEFFPKGRMSNAEIMIARRKNLEAKRNILEVLKNQEGQVVFRQK